MMLKKILVFVVIVLILSLVYQTYTKDKLLSKLNKAEIELHQIKQEKPKEIVITDTKVEYRYRDGKTIVKEKVPEGYVKFDLDRYTKITNGIDSLSVQKYGLELELNSLLQDAVIDETEIGHLKNRITYLNDKIKVLTSDLFYDESEDNNFIVIKNKGFTFRPQIGVGYNGSFSPYVGAKIAFWNRYGLIVGSTTEQAGIGISRRIDDIIPFVNNTEIMFLGGIPYKEEYGNIFIGLSVNI